MKKIKLILFGLLYFGSMPMYSREPFDFFNNLEKKLFPFQGMHIPLNRQQEQSFEHNFWKEFVKTKKFKFILILLGVELYLLKKLYDLESNKPCLE